MPLTIWKYPLAITDRQTVMMPEFAHLLNAQTQEGTLCLWALVNPDPETPKRQRLIEIVGTGNPMSEANRRYISTTQMCNGTLVWHIFEII